MAAYPPGSPQADAAAVLAAAGLDVNPLLEGDAPDVDGQVQVRLAPFSLAGTAQLDVVLIGAPGADLWSMLAKAIPALRGPDFDGEPLIVSPIYALDVHQITISCNTASRL